MDNYGYRGKTKKGWIYSGGRGLIINATWLCSILVYQIALWYIFDGDIVITLDNTEVALWYKK